MAKKLFDADGKEITAKAEEAPVTKKLFDVNGSPLLTPPPGYSVSQPTGGENAQMMTDTAKQAAPYIGRLAANSIPAVGGTLFGTPGAGGGSIVKQGLQNLAPGLFGKGPQDVGDFASTLGVDLTTQGILPAIVSKILGSVGSIPGIKQGMASFLSKKIAGQYASQPESEILEQGGKEASKTLEGLITDFQNKKASLPSTLEVPSTIMPGQKYLQNVPYGTPNSTPHPDVTDALDSIKDTFGKNTVGKALVKLQKEAEAGVDVAKSQTYKSITNTAYSDLTHIRNMKLVTSPEMAANLGYSKLLGSTEGGIDAAKILKELGGPKKEIYEEGLGAGLSNFKDMLQELSKHQKEGIADRILSYSKGHLTWAIPAMLKGGSILSPIGATATAAVVTNSMLARAMANPTTAKLITTALKTPSSSPQAGFIQKALMGALRGSLDVATTPDQ